MAFGKQNDDTAVGPASQKPCACLVGREEQSNRGGAAPTGRMNLGDTCYQKGAVEGGEGSLQKGSWLGTVVLEGSVPLELGGRVWVEKEIPCSE